MILLNQYCCLSFRAFFIRTSQPKDKWIFYSFIYITSDKSPFLAWILAMLSSHVLRNSGVLAYEFARLYCRSTSISGSFSCSFIWAVAIKTVLMRLVRSFTSAGKLTFFGKDKQYITKTIKEPHAAPLNELKSYLWKTFFPFPNSVGFEAVTVPQYVHTAHKSLSFFHWCAIAPTRYPRQPAVALSVCSNSPEVKLKRLFLGCLLDAGLDSRTLSADKQHRAL